MTREPSQQPTSEIYLTSDPNSTKPWPCIPSPSISERDAGSKTRRDSPRERERGRDWRWLPIPDHGMGLTWKQEETALRR